MERYEQLRAHAINGEPCGFRLGLALLERHGVIAWSRASQSANPTRIGSVQAIGPAAGDVELVGVLASMALAAAG